MQVTSRTARQKSWQSRRAPFSVLAEMALKQERVIETLEHLRERHGLSQEQAAQRVGITSRQWQRWESGESMPYGRNLSAVADAFKIPLSRFFDDEELVYDAGQLDRIEQMLEEVLAILRPQSPAEVLELEADRLDERRQRNDEASPRTRRSASGS